VSAIIKDLYVYPIQSFRGVRLDMMKVDENGPAHDRQFLLVDENNGFLTQRQIPELARIGLRLIDDAFIELSQTGFEEMDFGLNEREEKIEEVTIWKAKVPAQEVNPEISQWLGEVLKRKVKLVRITDNAQRNFDPDAHAGRNIRFTDATPFLVLSTESLKMLEQKAKVTLSMTRFRPNIVVDGVAAHAEDEWKGFSAGRIKFDPLHQCTRCKITTVHPLTGEVGPEPLQTLATYRKGEKGVVFGKYYAHLDSGTLRIGDKLTTT
jgi:uncharacterized protein YcbX